MSLTIDEMKKALTEKGVSLPGNRAKKDEYVKLYEEHIILNNSIGDNYSSDEENSQSSKKVTSTNSALMHDDAVKELTNDELYERLLELGYAPGPVLDNTRSVYEKKYLQLLRGEDKNVNGNNIENSFQIDAAEISDNEVEIGRPYKPRNIKTDSNNRNSPKPSSTNQRPPSSERSEYSRPTRISYIEKVSRSSAQRIIEPADSSSFTTTGLRSRGGPEYVGQWSPNIKRFTNTAPTTQSGLGSTKNILVFLAIGAILVALLVVGYHQWSVSDPYKTIEDDAEQEVEKFVSKKDDA